MGLKTASLTSFQVMLTLQISGQDSSSKRLGNPFQKFLELQGTKFAWKQKFSRACLSTSRCLRGQKSPGGVAVAGLLHGWLHVYMLRPQVMLTRQHHLPCPQGLKQEIAWGRFICSFTSVCTFLVIYKHWFLGAEIVSSNQA